MMLKQALETVLDTALSPNNLNGASLLATQYRQRVEQALTVELPPLQLLQKLKLSDEMESTFGVDKECSRIIYQNESIGCNFDRLSKYNMKYYCKSCFIAEDHSECNMKISKNHGICKNIARDKCIDKLNQDRLRQEVFDTNEARLELYMKVTEAFKTGYSVLFENTKRMIDADKEDLVEEIFQQLNDMLEVSCQSTAGMLLIAAKMWSDPLVSAQEGQNKCRTLLETYYMLNSVYFSLPTSSVVKLFSYMTIFVEFNTEAVRNIFKYLMPTYLADQDDHRMMYYQTIYKMVSFDTDAISNYIQSTDFVEVINFMRVAIKEGLSMEKAALNPENDECILFGFSQLTILLDNDKATEALCSNKPAFEAFFQLQWAFQDLEFFDIKKDSYLTDNIEDYNRILEIHDAAFLVVSTIVHRLCKATDRKAHLMAILQAAVAFSDAFQPLVMKSVRYLTLLTPIQRIFALVTVALLTEVVQDPDTGKISIIQSINKKSLDPIMKEIFSEKKLLQKFFTKFFRETMRTMGFCYEVTRKMWSRFGDDEFNYLLDDYQRVYFSLFDADIAFLKMAFLYVPEQELATMHQYFTANTHFSSLFDVSDPKKIYERVQEDWFEKAHLLYKDFWTFINFMLVDELSLSNLSMYSVSEELCINSENKNLSIFDIAKQFAKAAVFCYGSCTSVKLSETAFWYLPYRVPFLKIIADQLQFDSKTQIFRLSQQDAEEVSKNLKIELFFRNPIVAADIYAKLDERKLNPTYLVTTHQPAIYKLNDEISCRFMSCTLVTQVFEFFNTYVIQMDLMDQLLPIFLRLTNNFTSVADHLDSSSVKAKKKAIDILKSHFVHTWAKEPLKNTSLAQMVSQIKHKIDHLNNDESMQNELQPSASLKADTDKKDEQKKKMQDKLAKLKGKMKQTQHLLLDTKTPETEMGETISEVSYKEFHQERIEPVCSFCLTKIEENAEYTTFVYLRFTKDPGTKILFPLLSSCGHSLHKACFSEYISKIKKPKSSHWVHQSKCIQCKNLSNSYISQRTHFVDIDFLKATAAEQQSNFFKSGSQNPADTSLANSMYHFLVMILNDRNHFSMQILLANYLEVYHLLLKALLNLFKSKPIEFAQRSHQLLSSISNEFHTQDIVRELMEGVLLLRADLSSQSKHQVFNKICDIFTRYGVNDIAGMRLAAFTTFLVNKRWTAEVSDESWRLMTSSSSSEHWETDKFYCSDVFKLPVIQEKELEVSQPGIVEEASGSVESISYAVTPEPMQIEQVLGPQALLSRFPLFVNLVNHYGKKGCSICHQWPKEHSKHLLLCLLCEDQICGFNCFETEDDIPTDLALNEIAHAVSKHSGTCVYISLFTGVLIVIENPLSRLLPNISGQK